MDKQAISAERLWIPISCVGILVAAGVSWGVMYQKVEGLRDQMSEVKQQLTLMDDKLDKALSRPSLSSAISKE